MKQDLDWIQLAQNTIQQRTFVNTVMNLRREFLDQLSDYHLLKKDHAPWSCFSCLFKWKNSERTRVTFSPETFF